MPARRKSSKVLEANGAFKNHPSRKRNDPVVDEPIGAPPEGFTPAEVAAWQGIVGRAPTGILTAADWQAVCLASKLFAEFLADYSSFTAPKITQLRLLLASFGMSPADRSKFDMPPAEQDENPFAQIMREYPHKKRGE